MRAVLAAGIVAVALVVASPARAADPSCESVQQQVDAAMLVQAEAQLRELAAAGKTCDGLLQTVVRSQRAAARLAALGDALAASDPTAAARAYRAADAIDHSTNGAEKADKLQQPIDPACWPAARLLNTGQVALAKAEYLTLQERGAPCAKGGLEAVKQRENAVTTLIAIGKGLDDAGDHDPAIDVLTTATNLDAGSKPAQDALDAAKSKDVFDRAEKQGNEWMDDLVSLGTWLGAALAWLAAALIALLLIAWLARVLKTLSRHAGSDDKRFPPEAVAIGWAFAIAGACACAAGVLLGGPRTGVVVALIALGVAFAVWLVLRLWPPGLRFLHRTVFELLLNVSDFGVAKDAKADGAGLAAQMSAAIREGMAPAGYAVDSAGAAGAQDAFDQVAAALSGIAPGKVAAAVLKLVRALLPSRVVTVAGHVHAQEGAGCGLTLKIVEGRGQLVRDVTLWQGAYGCTSATPSETALRRLAIAGAAWLRFALKDVYDLPFTAGTCSKTSWESEAAYQASLAARGELEVRRSLVDVALAYDPDNLPALFDAAVLDLRQGAADRAVRRLRRVIAGTKPGKALWCKAMYQCAAIDLAAVPADGTLTQRVRAARVAYRIARRALLSVLRQIDEGKSPELDELRRLEGPLLVSTASIVLLMNGTAGSSVVASREYRRTWRSFLLKQLEWTGLPSTKRRPPLAAALIAAVDAGDVVVGERTHYNLACYASRRAALSTGEVRTSALDESLTQLGLALASGDPGLKSWAQDDAGLAEVRKARPGAFAMTTGVEAPRELAGIRSIGPVLAKSLEEEGILFTSDLATATRDERTTIAERLRVQAALVDRWKGLARLRRLPLMTDEHVNQLAEAGIWSPVELAKCNADNLHVALLKANGFDAALPTRVQLEVWLLESGAAGGGG